MSDTRSSFWLVWNPQAGSPTRQHDTFQSARIESERLARANRGQRFIVLQSVEECVIDDIVRTKHEPDHFEPPF
jgi:hypothetical protein